MSRQAREGTLPKEATLAYGKLLAEYREVTRLSQAEVGKRLGKPGRETLSLKERGSFSYAPSPEQMQRIEDVLGFSVLAQLEALGYIIGPPAQSEQEWT